eukprot:IDg8567t1
MASLQETSFDDEIATPIPVADRLSTATKSEIGAGELSATSSNSSTIGILENGFRRRSKTPRPALGTTKKSHGRAIVVIDCSFPLNKASFVLVKRPTCSMFKLDFIEVFVASQIRLDGQ